LGLVTEAADEDCRFGFCHWAAAPGELVALDSFYIGNLKSVGRVYQLTAVDTATRWAIVAVVLGTPDSTVTARFLEAVVRRWRRFGFGVRAVLSDNGPEYVAAGFRAALAAKGITHVRIPNHNAMCERFQGTALQEWWRPAFHRRRFTSTRQLRRNHGDFMRGRTPREVLDSHLTTRAA
jgi:transposase InsO family protein